MNDKWKNENQATITYFTKVVKKLADENKSLKA